MECDTISKACYNFPLKCDMTSNMYDHALAGIAVIDEILLRIETGQLYTGV